MRLPKFSLPTPPAWAAGVGDPAMGFGRYLIARRVFLIGLGLTSVIAFLSLAVQIQGLIGDRGILPLQPRLDQIAEVRGDLRYLDLPTIFWWNASETFVRVTCYAGAFLGLLLMAGVLVPVVLPLLFVAYLSLVSAGGPFLSFQWDALLLETLFAACFLGPALLWLSPGDERQPWAPSLWLLRILLLKLMLCSGIVKLASGDPAWADLSALEYHFWTQPLPHTFSWFVHQWPPFFGQLGTLFMFAVELVLPFFIFAPRRFRHVAGLGFLLLQSLIVATGNYGFFNLLSVCLAVLLFDDTVWPAWLRKIYYPGPREEIELGTWDVWRRVLATAPIAVLCLLSLFRTVDSIHAVGWAEPVPTVRRWTAPFRINNGYGLFSVMTTTRPELQFEGSVDGLIWEPYEFRYKAGDTRTRPRFVLWGHMPRLDWQLWFAALGSPSQRGWVERFAVRLLEGEPVVLQQLEENPFEETPPRYLRVRRFDYRFTGTAGREATGDWWARTERDVYLGPISLRR